MRRRRYLAALSSAAALAGCIGNAADAPADDSPADSPTDTPTPTPGSTPEDPGGDWSTLVDYETGPRTVSMGFPSVRPRDGVVGRLEFESTATADSPATLRATLTNETDHATTADLEFLPGWGEHVSDAGHEPWRETPDDYDDRLVFAPAPDHPLVDDAPEVERGPDGYWRTTGMDSWLPDSYRLAAGETLEGQVRLVGHPETDGLPTGLYGFHGDDIALSVAVWDSDHPGPEGESRFAGDTVPAMGEEASVGWFHEADAGTPTYVRPETERTDLPAAVEFTFVNHAREEVGCGHWNCYKLVDGEWFHLGPHIHTSDCRMVPPGSASSTTLRLAGGELTPCDEPRNHHGFGHVGGGRYALVSGYGRERSTGALLSVDAPPATLTTTDDATVRRDGDTVTVTTDRWGSGEYDDTRLVLQRADSASRRLIPEQITQDRALRNAVAAVEEGVDRVVVRTDERAGNRLLGFGDETSRFRFEGQAFRAAIEEA